jgi:hypothetical protein
MKAGARFGFLTDMNIKNNALWHATLHSQHGILVVFQQTVIFLDNIVMQESYFSAFWEENKYTMTMYRL